MFFRGYVETKDKQCVEKFKGRTDFKTYEQVKSLPEFAGILAEDTILVDLDDEESSDVLFKVVQDYSLNCRVYRTTRGKHFLFKNSGVGGCKTHCTLAIGLKADIKVGVKSSYEVLKYGGVEREILYDTAENEQAQPLPRWLFPVRSKMAFLDMEEGDGRNQALFNYILTLQSNDFTVEEARETIRIINKYVLKVPLSDSEIETILRDDSFKKPVFYNGSTFLFDKFAIFLKNNAHIIKINNQLHIYKDGIYTAGYGEIEAAMIKHIPDLNRAKRSEVVDYLDLLIRDNTKPEDAHLIAFKNGLYNIIDGSFAAFTPEHIITNKIPWDYTPDATCPLVDNVLNRLSCNDAEIRALLEEVAGACLYRDNKLGGGKAVILLGDKSNGKSTYIEMLHAIEHGLFVETKKPFAHTVRRVFPPNNVRRIVFIPVIGHPSPCFFYRRSIRFTLTDNNACFLALINFIVFDIQKMKFSVVTAKRGFTVNAFHGNHLFVLFYHPSCLLTMGAV